MTTLSFERDVNEEGIPRSNINLVVTDLTTAPIDVKTLDDFNAIVQEQLSMAVESLKFVHQKASAPPFWPVPSSILFLTGVA